MLKYAAAAAIILLAGCTLKPQPQSDNVISSDVSIAINSSEDTETDSVNNTTSPDTDEASKYIVIYDEDYMPENFNGHIITFDSMGGSKVLKEYISEGSTSYLPIDPEKEGYTFVGWFENDTDLDPYFFGGPLEEDITLYARWADNGFLLTASEQIIPIPASG